MPSYEEWNEAIIRFHTRNVPKGSPVYLTVNDEAVRQVGRSVLGLAEWDVAYEDFIIAVRGKCTNGREEHLEVCLDGLGGINEESGLPNGIAFLAITVLAAHKMANAEGIDHTNYFRRLRQVLGFSAGGVGRPPGLDVGQEEPLWRSWGMWLDSNGWAATAERGPEGPMRYINYPIGQALLRNDDVQYLERKYLEGLREPKALRALDQSQLGGWLLRQRLDRSHLREGFEGTDLDRVSAFFDEAYKVYQSMAWEQTEESVGTGLGLAKSTKVIAGLLRQPSMRGGAFYKLFPRVPAHWQGEEMVAVGSNGEESPLDQYRPGLFRPLWSVDPIACESRTFKVNGSTDWDEIVLPARRFWILTPDPEDMHGAFATWEKYPSLLGKKFLLIVEGGKDDVLSTQMLRFKEHGKTENGVGLIDWECGPVEVGGRTEFHGCMVLSAAWESIIPVDEAIELYEALKPVMKATIALTGGLKASGQAAWIEGYPPIASIYGFEKVLKFRVVKGERVLYDGNKSVQTPFDLNYCKDPGLYRLEVLWKHSVIAGKALRVLPWDALEMNLIDEGKWIDIGTSLLSGVRVDRKTEGVKW
ncbi:MAG: hypothetical protein HGB00_08195 [Chlorobiaceae bacterium]|nr:hypothetical protein [Chlorobiaceae bacterium]